MTPESNKDEPIKATRNNSPNRTILLVDDWDESRITIKFMLSNFGFSVDCARTAEEALVLFDPKIHDAIVSDNTMIGMTGLEMAHVIKMRSPNTPVVMYSGSAPDSDPCVDEVIHKPGHVILIKMALDKLLS